MGPTKEEIRRLWAKCGFKFLKKEEDSGVWDYGLDIYAYPDGAVLPLPDIDLNNLFKYAVPKITELGFTVNIVIKKDYNGCFLAHESGTVYGAEDENLEDALFWAINSVLGGNQ